MSISDVKTKIDRYISNKIIALSSQNNDLNSPKIDSVINTYFAGNITGSLQLVNSDTATIENEQVIYQLSLDTQNFFLYKNTSPIEAKIIFFIHNDVVEFIIETKMPKSYHFADSFSELANQSTLPINQVTIKNCVFTIQSQEVNSVDFKADLQAIGSLERIAWMTTGDLKLKGTIHFQTVDNKQLPIFNLTANILKPLKPLPCGIFTLDIAIRLKSFVYPIPDNTPSYLFLSQVELVTEFKTSKLTIPVIMPLYGKEQYLLSFYLDLAKPKPAIKSLNDLSGFTDNNDPANLLDVKISLGNAKFSLDSVSAILNPVTKQLVNIQFGISFSLNWTIITNTLELEKVGAVFTINNPTQPKKENIGVYLFAELKIGSIFLETSISLPEKILQAKLEQGSEIDVNEVINTLARGVTLPGDDELKIYDLEVYANVKTGEEAYSFQAAASGDLTIIDGLVINNIALWIEYQNKSFSDVKLSSTLSFTNAGVELFLLANYQNDNGWDFQGSTGDGQEIPIGKLIEDITKLFGNVTLPSAIEDLTIQNLGISFNTKTKNFTFDCQSKLSVDGKEIDITIQIKINNQDNKFSKEFYLLINTLAFNIISNTEDKSKTLISNTEDKSKTLIATYNNSTGDTLIIKTLVADISNDIATYIPASLQITLKDALFIYDKTTQTPPNDNNQNKSKFIFGLNLSSKINLTNLPLVGKQFPPEQTISIDDLQFVIASQNINLKDAEIFNKLLSPEITKIPLQPTETSDNSTAEKPAINKGLNLSGNLNFGDTTQTLALPVASDNPETTTNTTENPQPAPITTETDNTQWYPLKKTFGILYFARIGIQYQQEILWFLLDASISSSGLTLTLDGLSIGSPLSKFEPKFNLKGIGISYESKGNIAIAGAFLRSTINGKDEYSGALIVKTETFTLSAIGSYTTTEEGHPSLFIYGILDKPIGGPPFFFVTALALGFGYNRSFILPTLEQIPEFPLVKAALNSSKADLAGLAQIQQELTPYIPPKTGEIFLAIGIKFTSFKIIDSFALLVATFGDQFTLNLIGISTLISPPVLDENINIPPLAQVRFALLARFVPAEGTLKVDGKILPDSYIFDKKCTISGGFAFYSWFKGDSTKGISEGDFVLTVGGYNPKFDIPPHYPKVDPVALNWQISPELKVKGSVYFALTASAIMAGGRLEAVWQSGNKRAWFIANAHFIVAWQPYFYDAEISLRIGASYTFDEKILGIRIRKTISVDLGANLHILGPEFSGTATVDLKIISFTIAFGARTQKKPDPLTWQKFKESFLPEQVCTIGIESGLLRKVELEQTKEEIFIVNPKEFVIATSSVIPIKTYYGLRICFSISKQLDSIKENLNQNLILDDLTTEFTQHQKTLSSSRKLQKNKENESWNITDGTNKYFLFIEKDIENKDILNVYIQEQLNLNTEDKIEDKPKFGITPMNVTDSQFTQSEYNIAITNCEKFSFKPIYKNIPTGLWRESNNEELNDNPNQPRFINNVLSGFTIKPANPPTAGATQGIERKNLAYDLEKVNNAYQWKSFDTFSENEEKENIGNNITSENVKEARNSLLQNLGLLISLKITLNFCILAFLRGAKNFALLRVWVIIIQKMNEIDLKEFETSTGKEQAFVISPCLQLSMLTQLSN